MGTQGPSIFHTGFQGPHLISSATEGKSLEGIWTVLRGQAWKHCPSCPQTTSRPELGHRPHQSVKEAGNVGWIWPGGRGEGRGRTTAGTGSSRWRLREAHPRRNFSLASSSLCSSPHLAKHQLVSSQTFKVRLCSTSPFNIKMQTKRSISILKGTLNGQNSKGTGSWTWPV